MLEARSGVVIEIFRPFVTGGNGEAGVSAAGGGDSGFCVYDASLALALKCPRLFARRTAEAAVPA